MKCTNNFVGVTLLALLLAILQTGLIMAQDTLAPPIVVGAMVNEAETPVLNRDWPILVNVIIMNEQAYDQNTPVQLSPDWQNALHFVIKDTSGQLVSWPLHLVAAPEENIILDSTTYAEVSYWLAGNETNAIPEGEYEFIAVLDSTAYSSLGNTFSSVESAPVSITISRTSDSTSLERKSEKDLLLTRLSIVQGDTARALEYAREIIAYDSTNIVALSFAANILKGEGDFGGALNSYARAVDVFYATNSNPEEPPFEVLKAQNRLRYLLDTAGSFLVTFFAKDTAHPAYGLGSSSCYYLDNIPFRQIQLIRGRTYTFHMKDIPSSDPFYVSTSFKGGGLDPYTDGVTGTPADSNGTVTITASNSTPNILYYQSSTHEYVGWRIVVDSATAVTSVKNDNLNIPKEYSLSEAYPNPFNPSSVIRYQLPVDSRVTLRIYNTLGQEVIRLVDGIKAAGYGSVEWNATSIASGVYFYRLEATSTTDPIKTFTQVKKMVLMK